MSGSSERLDWICGPFERQTASIDESKLVHQSFRVRPRPTRQMLMVDVGAHFGGSLRPFASSGWEVHSFEPDPENRARLVKAFGHHPEVTINDQAITTTDGDTLKFFKSPESTGVSTLSPFLDSHESTLSVKTRRLDHYMHQHDITHVDYLKVDTEGFDGFSLQSFPFHRDRPDFITCEFEDFKTRKLGYTANDLAEWLAGWGYSIFVSEWHPIVRYGISHDFRGIWRYRSEVIDTTAWGNLIAVSQPDLINSLEAAASNWDVTPA